MSASSQRFALGIDVGGTKILSAVVDREGNIVSRDYTPTGASDGPEAVIKRIVSAAERVLKSGNLDQDELCGVGLAVAGIIDTKQGIITTSPNLPGWKNLPLRDLMAQQFGNKTFLVNDADAAALGENRFGAGRGTRHMIYVTVSTGIGGGIIIDGELYSGVSGCAGEFGHMTIDPKGPKCACGRYGCWEALASGSAIAREALRRIIAGEDSIISQGTTVTAETVGEAAARGDRLASEVISVAGHYLGIGLANIINIFNPEMVVIGGGVSNLGDRLLQPALETVKRQAFDLPLKSVRVVKSQIGAIAGVLGAAAVVFDRAGKGDNP